MIRQPFDYMGAARMTPRVAPLLMGQAQGAMQGAIPTKLPPEPAALPPRLPPEQPLPTKLPPEMPMNPTPMNGSVYDPASMAEKLKAMQLGRGGMRFPF